MFNFNAGAQQHILATDGQSTVVTPRAATCNARRSFNSIRGLTVVAMLLLNCSPSFVSEWRRTLSNRYWADTPVDVLAVRKSRAPGRVDAILVVNRQAQQWKVIANIKQAGLIR